MGRLKSYTKYVVAYVLWAFYTFPNVAYANAVGDIMNDERFTGAIESIEWLTGRVDYYFTMIISATAFFIISAALLKNACAGAYCANPKFWDKVHEAHTQIIDQISVQNLKNFKNIFNNASAKGIGNVLLCLVPNIKAMTDFEENDISPKDYFMKAIPQMLLCIIIGVFIYNGYYRDTAATVGQFGAEICDRVFSSVDPGQFLDKLSQTTGTPDNIYEKDTTLQGRAIYTVSKEMYKVCLSGSKNLSSTEAKTALMRGSEAAAFKLLVESPAMAQFFNDARVYDWSVTNLNITLTNEVLLTIGDPVVKPADPQNNDMYTVQYYCTTSNIIPSEYLGEGNAYAFITCNMVGSEKSTLTGLTDIRAMEGVWKEAAADPITLTVGTSGMNAQSTGDGTVYTGQTMLVPLLGGNSAVTQSVQAWCQENGATLSGAVTVVSYSGFDQGPADKPSLRWKTDPLGTTKSGSMRVSFMYKKQGDTKSIKTTLSIPWSVTLQ